ncbi:MAG TPA: acyclic terpene utilization AtuA family protein [Pirellulales bacterium]|jgi:hypothetical protein|nr:acyclic terpene utilization AtuA family protein [Pirellulales bacterium]
MPLRIANAAGFLGDQLDAPRRLVEGAQRAGAPIDYLTLEYLAELTLSILARQREKNPAAGFAEDFLYALKSLGPALRSQAGLKIVTNAGGMNPTACAQAAAKILQEHGLTPLPIGVVTGDDLLGELASAQAAGERFANFDSGAPLATLARPIVSANAYLGAEPIARALAQGSRLVITGRVADASLTLGPAVHEFGWDWTDWDRLAGASVAGHLIECGAQVTGGYSDRWQTFDLTDVGYPIAELEADGSCVITLPAGSGGTVDRLSVVSQLVYEIGDPQHYLTPDVDCDFTTVTVAEVGPNRIRVQGGRGRPAPPSLKVSLAYRQGFAASGQLLVYGSDCVEKAQVCGRMILDRLARAGWEVAQSNIECLGGSAGVPGLISAAPAPTEVVLRVSVADPRQEAVARFTREFAPLITSGPAGLAGYAAGLPTVRPVFAYWPTLIARDRVHPQVDVRSAAQWLS